METKLSKKDKLLARMQSNFSQCNDVRLSDVSILITFAFKFLNLLPYHWRYYHLLKVCQYWDLNLQSDRESYVLPVTLWLSLTCGRKNIAIC